MKYLFQHRMKDTLDSWLKVQAAWLYLEPIFGSEDIRSQIPVEGQMFVEVDEHWSVTVLCQCSVWLPHCFFFIFQGY